jgi:hypothetical protein
MGQPATRPGLTRKVRRDAASPNLRSRAPSARDLMYRVRLLDFTGSDFHGAQQIRLLRIYLTLTTFLYCYGTVFAILRVRRDLVY